jgi:hypothetical protein
VCADTASELESHASLESLFIYAGASGDPPLGSKHVKALAWLRATNKDANAAPLRILGKIIESWMEAPLDPSNEWHQGRIKARHRLAKTLAECGLTYVQGGVVTAGLGSPTRGLSDFIRNRDYAAIDQEFQRALDNVDTDPREAVSAASNIVESVCKVMIEDEHLEKPSKQDLQGVWSVVRKHLRLDPSLLQDKDLQQILSGIISVVHGIGSLRTHASSAHGAGRSSYKLEPRHARLAIHSAHTIALFVLESWHKRKPGA